MVKILGDGEITKAFKISGCYISESAKEKVTKAGGSIEAVASKTLVKAKTEAEIKKASAPKKEKIAKPVEKVEEKKKVAKVKKADDKAKKVEKK